MEYRTKLADVKDALMQCDLCHDKLVVEYPNTKEYWFEETADMLRPLMGDIEDNIERNGGYMTDEWGFVHAEEQQLRDVRSCVRLVFEEEE